jgi:hypothetical protein
MTARGAPFGLSALDEALLARLLTPEVRARVGPVSPLFARPPRLARREFEADGLLGPLRSVLRGRAGGELFVAEAYAPDAPPVPTTLRLAVVWPDRDAGAAPRPGDAGVVGGLLSHLFRTTAVWRVEAVADPADAAAAEVLARAGLSPEGVRRASAVVAGRLVDRRVFAATRDTHPRSSARAVPLRSPEES